MPSGTRSSDLSDGQYVTDIAIVGTGVAGLTAALTAKAAGLEPIVLERAELVGGSSALAGGGMWVPANRFMLAGGDVDSAQDALRYLDELIGGDGGPSASPARREAFVTTVPTVIGFLEQQGLLFRRTPGYLDYHPDVPGASVSGRGIESVIFDTNRLGAWAGRLPERRFPRNLPMGSLDVNRVVLARRTWAGFGRYAHILAHHGVSRLRGQRLVGGGGALVAQLLYAVVGAGIPIWTEAPVSELVTDGDRVTGVVAERNGAEVTVLGRRGVFLGAGGFARSDEMRARYHPQPAKAAWSSASQSDLGDGIRLGLSVSAATALMDEVWGGPSSKLPDGPAIFHVSERAKPGSLIVDSGGRRYMNEAMPYVEAVHVMYERHQTVTAVPSWLVFDTTYRHRYPFGTLLPFVTPRGLIDNGYLKRERSLAELARTIGVDPGVLGDTVARHNGFARSGIDEDFHRGEDAYDRYYGDPRVRPNPCLAPIARPPFYAVALYPGDLGTKGGLVTDVDGRVMRADGTPIEGLYASGNTTASVMGRHYPGPGVTLAPAATFAYRAMTRAAAASR